MEIRHVKRKDFAQWLRMRHALWLAQESEHRAEIERFFQGKQKETQEVLVVEKEPNNLIGFAELSIRSYAEGCQTDRVAYLEGWYVDPDYRKLGIGRRLIAEAEIWARQHGCTEFASDTQVDNEVSAKAHQACGFEDVGLVRCFRKDL